MKYIYLLFSLIIIYLLYCYYKKYIYQENFDPSLVPVSSIVTLAKVAQKLVDGGGTLTNPGNLQIGLPSAGALGNLYVTGTNKVDGVSTFNGNTTMGNTLGVTGATTMSSTLDVTGVTTLNGGVNITGTNSTTTMPEVNGAALTMNNSISAKNISIGPYSDPTYDVIRSGAPAGLLLSSASKKIYVWGNNDLHAQSNVTVNKNLDVTGYTTLNGTTTLKEHISFYPSTSSKNEGYTLYNGGDNMTGGVVSNSLDMHTYQNGGWRAHALSVGNDGNVNLYNNLNVAKKLCLGSTCINEHTLNTFLFPMVQIIKHAFPNAAWARSIVDDIYPVMFWDGWITDSGAGYLYRSGVNIPNVGDYKHHYQNVLWGPRDGWDYVANDKWNYVIVAPGYGVKGWTFYDYTNDNNENGNQPYTVENKTSTAMVRRLDKDSNSEVTDGNGNELPNASYSVWDKISSIKIYKL